MLPDSHIYGVVFSQSTSMVKRSSFATPWVETSPTANGHGDEKAACERHAADPRVALNIGSGGANGMPSHPSEGGLETAHLANERTWLTGPTAEGNDDGSYRATAPRATADSMADDDEDRDDPFSSSHHPL